MPDEGQDEPIALYFCPTPNGYQISIMLEELLAPYCVLSADDATGAQLNSHFAARLSEETLPAIVDPDGPDGQPLALSESGAILHYLARKYDAFYPMNERTKADVDQWLFWQVGRFGPMAMECEHFRHRAPERMSYVIDRYTSEIARLFGDLERRLETREYLAGAYSIADIATFPWARMWRLLGQDSGKFPNVERWLDRVGKRPAVIKGLAIKVPETARRQA
ncbi:glutathione S-transferase [Hyphomicrobium methylovorum]|uniref:glutathione binding-like protein n=1 Tax=Hyphomicrobium methylovorum TaxID=84 RepID=UPI0015E6F20F|nr:glutathione binding-like protein [Hyphomicrobium methylovorum]MBA2127168.1 glutathione S-transferase [Hyphomicrobium methylovorum]